MRSTTSFAYSVRLFFEVELFSATKEMREMHFRVKLEKGIEASSVDAKGQLKCCEEKVCEREAKWKKYELCWSVDSFLGCLQSNDFWKPTDVMWYLIEIQHLLDRRDQKFISWIQNFVLLLDSKFSEWTIQNCQETFHLEVKEWQNQDEKFQKE